MADSLDPDLIYRSISNAAREHLDSLDVLDVVPSTNTWLMQQEHHEKGRFHAALAKHQTAGRGRQGKRWYCPPKAGVCLSLGYTFKHNPNNISCLTLAAGVATTLALNSLGANGLRLKWPNDIYADNAKLGGILTDAQTATGGRITMICGVGINCDLSLAGDGDEPTGLDYLMTDLRSHMDELPQRSLVAGAIIDRLILAVLRFEEEGLDPFRADWNRVDWLRNKKVVVDMPDSRIQGIADGIDANGALRVITEQGRRRVYTGSVWLAGQQPGDS